MRLRHAAILSMLLGLVTAPAMAVDPSDSVYDLSEDDAIALVGIASMDDQARLRSLDRAINDSSWRAKLLRQPETMINAIVGTSLKRRNLASPLVIFAAAAQTESGRYPSDTSEAIARVANALDVAETVPLSWWLAAIDANKMSPNALEALICGLAPLADKLTVDQAKTVIAAFLTAINANTTSPDVLDALAGGLAPLAEKLSADQAHAVIPLFLTAIDANKTSPDALYALERGLAALTKTLTADQAVPVVPVFLAAIDANKTSPDALRALGRGLAPLGGKLTADQAKAVIATFLTSIDTNKSSHDVLFAIGAGLVALADELMADQGKAVIPAFLATIDANKTSSDALGILALGLTPLTDKLTADQAKAVTAASLAILQVSRRALIVRFYARLLAAADSQSPDGERVLHILRVLDHPFIDDYTRRSLIASLSSIAGPQNDFKGRFWDAVAWAESEAKAGRLAGYPPPPLFPETTSPAKR